MKNKDVFPNPARSYFIIEYELQENEGDAVVLLSDINGRMLNSFTLGDKQNQLLMSTDSFPSGMYIVQLFINGELRESHKVQIIK